MDDYSPALTVTATTSEQTAGWGAALSTVLKTGDVVLLYGDLGAGKTTFSRGLIQGLSPDAGDIVSPTFTLVQSYDLTDATLYHYDLYRLEKGDASTLTELGWDEALRYGITLVEWPERLAADFIPPYALRVEITPQTDDSRILKFSDSDTWHSRLHGLQQ